MVEAGELDSGRRSSFEDEDDYDPLDSELDRAWLTDRSASGASRLLGWVPDDPTAPIVEVSIRIEFYEGNEPRLWPASSRFSNSVRRQGIRGVQTALAQTTTQLLGDREMLGLWGKRGSGR